MAQQNQQNQQNQQQSQSQMQGQGAQIQDRDLLQVCLNETKHTATSINIFIQEATNDQLRRDYMTVLGDIYSQEKQLFDYMQQQGFYNVKNAKPEDIAQAKNTFNQSQPQQM